MPKSSKSDTTSDAAGSPAAHPFDPIIDEDSKILILGSFPSLKSFEKAFYYAHPRNQFWPLLSDIFQKPASTKEERIALLKSAGIALWDVIAACERRNSADSNLKACEPNDIPALLQAYPNIGAIGFTGKKAESLFKRHFGKKVDLPTFLLPSPSPAYAALSYEEKLKRWRDILSEYL
ncbi:DNA-deoxyinosine glycosylase [Hydrogenimonas sp. SS33]|uniref:DNA-deoxyinosine glycosylase n=1 Tax=Hydrogenimonas leucolamina TaxID=2954236 RepID=UPI00336BEE47